jgi:hypothetical protein
MPARMHPPTNYELRMCCRSTIIIIIGIVRSGLMFTVEQPCRLIHTHPISHSYLLPLLLQSRWYLFMSIVYCNPHPQLCQFDIKRCCLICYLSVSFYPMHRSGANRRKHRPHEMHVKPQSRRGHVLAGRN